MIVCLLVGLGVLVEENQIGHERRLLSLFKNMESSAYSAQLREGRIVSHRSPSDGQ